MRARVHFWLERPDRDARGPRLLEISLILLIVSNVFAVMLETVDEIYMQYKQAFDLFEGLSLVVYIVEYLARFWVAPENTQVKSRLKWALTPSAIIDLIAILPALLFFLVPIDLRILRAIRMLRLLKLTRYSPALSMLLAVFEEEAGAFFAGFFILSLMLVLAASGAWMFEHEAQPQAFGSILAAMWWAVATLTTVGYGDVTPITIGGKIFGAIITILGIGMAALPAGIIASGLNDQLHRRRESLKRQFRLALEDGTICEQEEEEIETLRKQLGLSHRAADQIREQIQSERARQPDQCPHCGNRLNTSTGTRP